MRLRHAAIVGLFTASLACAAEQRPAAASPEPQRPAASASAPAPAAPAQAPGQSAPEPAPTEGSVLATVATTATLPAPALRYDRDDWGSWIDADGDCQDTRAEVLIATSQVPVEFRDPKGCTVARGRWCSPYSGVCTEDASKLDIDHVVPLANAHRSGGASWPQQRKRAFANELSTPNHLLPSLAAENRSKGDRGPDEWLPELPEARCAYVELWVEIKVRWELAVSPAEAQAIDQVRLECDIRDVSGLTAPGSRGAAEPAAAPAQPTTQPAGAGDDQPRECCRVCRDSQACGDSCISRTKTCRVDGGCACQG